MTFLSINRYTLKWELRDMNKKDIAAVRQQFKFDNELMDIETIFNVYVQKESGDIYHHLSQPFALLDQESQELFLVNFKKVLTGQLDSKLFELKFKRDIEDCALSGRFGCLLGEDTEGWGDLMLQSVDTMCADTTYDCGTVVTFIIGEHPKPSKHRNPESGEGGTDHV